VLDYNGLSLLKHDSVPQGNPRLAYDVYFIPSQLLSFRLQTLQWSCNLRQLIPIKCLHYLPQLFMTIILLIPHIFVISHLPSFDQSQANKTIVTEGALYDSWEVVIGTRKEI
jgi:hypothetical protein